MNIFVLDEDPETCARYHCDKHVLKMIIETAQLLCTAHHVAHTDASLIPYKRTHTNHPCAVWARESLGNYLWLCELGLALCEQYTERYGKVHKTQAVLEWCRDHWPDIPEIDRWSFVQCMPNPYKKINTVEAYRAYYISEKAEIATWKNDAPGWWIE